MTESRPRVSVPDKQWLELWPETVQRPVEVVVWDFGSPAPQGISLVVPPYMGPPQQLRELRTVSGLRAVQLLTAGYEHALPYLPDGVPLANAAGVHDASTAELALGLTISALRGIGEAAQQQLRGHWANEYRPALADKRVLVMGVGGVGSAIVARLEPFEVQVTRVGSHDRMDDRGHVHAISEVAALLPTHDVVILAVPLSASTRALVDAEFLALMPDGALLVNVARGPVVDTDALVAELASGRLRAALDVTDPEPLPPDHPLWRTPNTLITPHVGGNTSAFLPRAKRLLREQFSRFAAQEPLAHLVRA